MKVLFAVNSENISDAIIKKYQKDYREILSYKNVYYFDAILKEIQKDKTYDRIVISEDLEPFSNNNYESIDKFIFEKLDGISDEAHDMQGNEISIILIASDRHTKGSSFLVKLFGISVYNALLGNDRSMEEVCRLINKPRTKKEAKMYYKIDTDNVNYRAENENEVSEIEIQNIIAHFKKLGKNTEKYASSFDNIAAQYTDEQLKIIINCLPMTVKAVLEEKSSKYQEIMAVSTSFVKGVKSNNVTKQDQKRTGLKIDILENKMNQGNKITQPIVIPNSVKSKSSNVAKNVVAIPQKGGETKLEKAEAPGKETVKPTLKKNGAELTREEKIRRIKAKKLAALKAAREAEKAKKATLEKTQVLEEPVNKVVRPEIKQNMLSEKEKTENTELPDLENMSVSTNNEKEANTAIKKKRGRPRKVLPENAVEAPKGKRGRPRKNPIPDIEDEIETNKDLDEDIFEDDVLAGLEENNTIFDEIEDKEEISNPVEIDELDGLDDLDDFESDNVEENTEEFSEESFDEFDDYDEYGEYETKTKSSSIDEDDELDDFDSIDEMEDLEETNSDDDIEEIEGLDDLDDLNIEDEKDELGSVEQTNELEDFDIEDELDNLEEPNLEDDLDELDLSDDLETLGVSNDDSEDDVDLISNYEDDDLGLDSLEEEQNSGFDDTSDDESYQNEGLESINPAIDYSMSNLNSLLTKDKKIVTFLGSPKNGVSFLVNNLAEIFASLGIDTAILDMTQNKNSYYIYTQNEENLRKIAYTSIENLQQGVAEGIKVKKGITVYTALPNDGKDYSNAEPILSTLVQNHSVVLIDCDFTTNPSYFASCQEIYLVQSMDILTIQPLTAFLRDLKTQGVLEPEKVRVVINKELKVRGLNNKTIIGGMTFYNDPSMSYMTELFSKDVKYCSIPFDELAYSRYLEALLNCKMSISGYSKNFINKLRILGDMVYPLTSRQSYSRGAAPQTYGTGGLSNSMNDTLDKMKKKY